MMPHTTVHSHVTERVSFTREVLPPLPTYALKPKRP